MSDDTSRMPAEIAKAVVKVMGEVKKIGKDTRNDHGKYNYVSVDQFFDQIGKLMSDAGMFVVARKAILEEAARMVEREYDGACYEGISRHITASIRDLRHADESE